MERTVFSVAQINSYIKDIFSKDFVLRSLFIKGEISNFKLHSTGHCYFSLKDYAGVIACVMFKGDFDVVPFEIENGMDVIIYGNISVYEKIGQYQIYVEYIEPVGMGALQLAFEQLKIQLNEEGLFDEDFKREIPENINNIAVVTSTTGAVIRDIIKVVKRRDPRVNIAVFPAIVQGDGGKNSIVKGIQNANEWGKADVIIVARGGGSMEDLWCFNHEDVARAIFASEKPVISAVGHETDFTICDFVADVRASTPSVAGELVTKPILETISYVESLKNELDRNMLAIYSEKKRHLEYLEEKVNNNSPSKKLRVRKEKLNNIYNRLNYIMENNLKNYNEKVNFCDARLTAVSPLQVMKRGYAVIVDDNKNKITSISQVCVEDTINLRLEDGRIKAKILDVK